MILNATTPPTMPAVACFLVMLDDARMQATYEHITGLAAPNAGYPVPTPFYTTPLVAGGRYFRMPGPNTSYNYARDGDSCFSCFDQHQRLARTQFWCRWSNNARPFPYDWAETMERTTGPMPAPWPSSTASGATGSRASVTPWPASTWATQPRTNEPAHKACSLTSC